MNDLTPSYEPDAGQVILEGRPAGPAGEAGLVPVAGVDLAFDRGDGHLVRVVADAGVQEVAGISGQAVAGTSGQAAAALLSRLFGPGAARVLDEVAVSPAGLDVAAEVEELKKDPGQRPGLNWVLDPALIPAGLIRPGLSAHSDLLVRYDGGGGRVTVAATLAPDADAADAARCQVRLVD